MMGFSLTGCVLFGLLITVPRPLLCAKEECLKGESYLYIGTHSTTKSGATCQRWDTNEPHTVKKVPQDGVEHNYCRNPDKDVRGTWCYTTDPEIRWEYCDLTKCDEGLVVWTSFDEQDNSSFFDHAKADPELMTQLGSAARSTFKKVFQDAQMNALAAGKNGKEIFFTDIRNNYLGVLNTKSLEVEKLLEGKMSHVYAISQDWVTGNFYWTDIKMKWILVGDREFRAQVPIHKTHPAEPRAITVIHAQRKLLFSTYVKLDSQTRDTQIILSDLAGKDKKVIFKLPDVTDVTGLAADNERMYWTDNLGYACKVMSSTLDGSDKTEHYMKKTSFFRDIAVYSNYIYVTDSQTRYNYFDHIRYNVDVISKDNSQIFTFTKPEIPHGIAILQKIEDDILPTPMNGVRKCLKSCGGVCLPGANGLHDCFCSFGYHLQQQTGMCLPKLVKNEYLLTLDSDSGRAYQIPLKTSKPEDDFSIAPFENVNKIGSLTTDLSTGQVFIFDAHSAELKKGKLNGDTVVLNAPIESAVKHMVVDPLSKNTFYVDKNNNIHVISADGSVKRTIVEKTDPSSDIKMIALDVKQKFIYWTDTHSVDGSGTVTRSKLNGKYAKVVLDGLERPHGLSYDCKSGKLFVMDAKTAILYELNPKSKIRIKMKSAKKYKTHNLFELVSARRFAFTEILAHNGFIYIVDEEAQHLWRYELGECSPEALSKFGPSVFYRPSSLSVYSSSSYSKNIATLPNPCKLMKCRKMCLDLSKKKAKCINI